MSAILLTMKGGTEMKLARINFDIPREIRVALKRKLSRDGYSIKGFMLKHIYKYLKRRR